jgi:hypothetical protein
VEEKTVKIQKQLIRWNALFLSLVLLSSPIITVAETLTPTNQVSEEIEISEKLEETDELEETESDEEDLLDESEAQEDNFSSETTVDEEQIDDSLREDTQELLRDPLDKQQYQMNTGISPHFESETLKFSFDAQTFQGVINQTYIFSFSSNKATNEVLVRVPKSARIVEDAISEDETVEHSHGEYWLLITNTPKTKFNLPLVFREIGGEFISINHDEDHMFINITENGKQVPDNLSIIQASESSLEFPPELWDKEEKRIFSQIPVSEDINGLNTIVSNWSQFRSAWNSSSTSTIQLPSSLIPSGLVQSLNTRSSSVTITGTTAYLNLTDSATTLKMAGMANLTFRPNGHLRITSSTDVTSPLIEHTGTGVIDISNTSLDQFNSASGVVVGHDIRLSSTTNVNLVSIYTWYSGPAVRLRNASSSMTIQNINSQSGANISSKGAFKPILGPDGIRINLNNLNRVTIGNQTGVGSNVQNPLASWHTVTAVLGGQDGNTVISSNANPNDFRERYLQNFNNSGSNTRYNTLGIGVSGGEWLEPPTPRGTVTVQHTDSSNNKLAADEVLEGNVGTAYSTSAKEIEGYQLAMRPSNASGTYTEQPITVRYIYDEIPEEGNVIVSYLDKRGNQLAESKTLTGFVGDSYQTEKLDIDGYYQLIPPQNASGTFEKENLEVNYEYVEIHDTLINPSFEEPTISANAAMLPQADVPGWYTTADDKIIEFGKGPSHNISGPSHGEQFAELNANMAGELFQLVSYKPGTRLRWILDHAGRTGNDTMRLNIGSPENPSMVAEMTSPPREWSTYNGTYIIPDNQPITYFGFEAVGNLTFGNLIDYIRFAESSNLKIENEVNKLSAIPGERLTYTITITNDGGIPADRMEIIVNGLEATNIILDSIQIGKQNIGSENIKQIDGKLILTPANIISEGETIELTLEADIPTNFVLGSIETSAEITYWDEHFDDEQYHQISNNAKTEVQLLTIPPLDPLDPDKEVNPDNPPVFPEDQGLVSIDFVSQFNFGEVAIQADKASYEALPQRLLNEDGTVSEERPNYVQISDRRSSEDRGGWSLSATLDDDGFKNSAAETLQGAEIHLANQELAKPSINTNSSPHVVRDNGVILTPGVSTRLLDANSLEGQGTWIYRFGNQENARNSVKLEVPKGANPKATSYQSTINWQLSIVPGNE